MDTEQLPAVASLTPLYNTLDSLSYPFTFTPRNVYVLVQIWDSSNKLWLWPPWVLTVTVQQSSLASFEHWQTFTLFHTFSDPCNTFIIHITFRPSHFYASKEIYNIWDFPPLGASKIKDWRYWPILLINTTSHNLALELSTWTALFFFGGASLTW